jgi:hypothetical protein
VPGFSFQPFVKDGTKYKNVDIPTAWTSDLRQTAAQTISAVINLVQDTIALENKSWVLATGTPPTTQPVNSAQSGAVRAAAVEQDPQDPAATTTTTTTPPAPPPQFSVDSNWHSGTKLELQGVTVQNGEAVVTVRVFNNNEKVYDIYAQYYNADGVQVDQFGNPPTKGTSPDLAVSLGPSLYACPTIVGIPVFDTNYVDYEVPIPSSVTTTNIMLATMGGKSGWQQYLVDANNNQLYPGLVFPQECKMAVIMTTVMNLAIPTILLVLDVVAFAQMFKSVFNAAGNVSRVALQDDVSAFFSGLKGLFPAVGGLADAISGFATASDYGTPDKPSIITVLVDLGLLIIGLISIPALVRVLALIYAGAATEEPVKAIPIVGEVFAAISAAADVAVLGQTAGEVGNDTWVSVRALTGTYDTVVTVMPEGAAFPPSATYWELIPELGMTDSQKAITDPNFQSNGPQVGPLKIPVPSVPFGNTITYKITFKEGPAGNPTWIVGSGSTNALPNSDPANLPEPTINITNVAPPVSTGSTFDRKFTSQFDTTASAYSWSTVATVPGTIADQQTCDTPQTVCQAGSIAVGALTGFVGYTYQSEQGWFVRQVGYPDAASGARGIATPFEAEPLLLYDSSGLDAASGQNFLLDPIVGANAYHVRQLNLTVDGLGFDRTTSWGVFFDTIHAVAVHPAGLLVGLNTDTGILHILQLPDAGMDELLAPAATMHAGKGNASGLRPGLTQSPVSVGVALNGMVLVLEQGANRIQAFDVRGNPTQYFTANGVANSSYYLPLVSQDTYLGMSLDGAGFIYTLSYSGDGSDPSQYGLDIYNATGVHIARSSGVNAATFVVDPWRNAYTQNFVALQESSGGAHVTPQGVAEPSTSVWALNTPYIPG